MSDPLDPVAVTPLGDHRFLLTSGGGQRVAFAVRGDGGTWVFLDGRTFIVPDPDSAPARAAARDDAGALAAPMPATVLAVNVAAGADVVQGDVLVVLEAMKMELPIKAPRDGRVGRVLCHPGQLVQPGAPLLELDPSAGARAEAE